MKKNYKIIQRILFFLIFIIMLLPLTSIEGAMNDYCVIPPFLSQSIPPNVLIVMDNSLSMCQQAYPGSYDPSQFDNGLYYGYFDGTKNYLYNGSRWEETTAAMSTGTVANPIANGSFLNWATMLKIEAAKKLLIGGKANPRSWNGSVTVKLDGETACGSFSNFNNDHNTSAGNLIYPFVGNYRFTRNNGNDLSVSPISGGSDTFYTYPTSDISVPSGWSEYPVVGAMIAYTKVDESSSDSDTTYIQNSNTTSPVMMGYSYTQAEPAGTITVTVKVRAKKTASSGTRYIAGVLKVDGVNYASSTSKISTSYSLYSFTWTSNPVTSAPWTWDQIKNIAGSGNIQGFGVKADGNYTSSYPRITQVYLDVSVTVPTGGPYKLIVDQGMLKAEGLLDTLSTDVRFGLANYATSNDGGKISDYVGFGVVTSMITSIHNLVPSTYTPLAETLYEMTRYFRQDDPYYSNSPADYSKGAGGANIIRDPYWYKYTDLDASLTDQYVPCAKSFVLFLTDGESTYDQSIPGSGSGACSLTNIKGCSSGYRFAGTTVGTTYTLSGTDYMIDVAFWARTNDMRPGSETDIPTTWRQSIPGTQNVYLYPVFMFGKGSTLLKDAAIAGGFNDLNSNNLPDCTTIPAECYRDTNGDGAISSSGSDDPLTYYEGDDGYALEKNIRDAINAILRRTSSGTAASVLASGEGRGANIVQAIFYPKRTFDNSAELDWTGTLQTFWYYIDPFFSNSNIREDTNEDGELNLVDDRIVQFYFDSKTKARRYEDTDGDGAPDNEILPPVDFEEVKSLWEAGRILWNTSTADRTIYTPDPSDSSPPISLLSFNTLNKTTLRDYLQAGSDDEAEAIIRYIRGEDNPVVSGTTYTYRPRTAAIDLNKDGDVADTVTINGTSVSESAKVWKLGDVVNSTPKILSWTYLNNYDQVYGDTTYEAFLNTAGYKDRGMVFVGANDGMLHAFKLGSLEILCRNCATHARMSGTDLGKEVWAFIPKHVLPYLKYNADPDYCHIYNVDLSPYIFDASINGNPDDLKDVNSWRTVLIGGMRLGGACKSAASTDGVEVPAAGKGYSSYFAIDVTDQNNPTLLWEFSDPTLGFATTGPSVVRIGDTDKTKNGKWFIIFGSGPTGPIDTTSHQFRGHSDQNLRLFVLDLKTGTLQRTIDTGITQAFAGSMINATNDPDLDYNDDAIYIPFVKRNAAGAWEDGGIGRLFTKENQNPGSWVWRKVIDGAGPVTSSIQRLQHKNKGQLWIYFGAGRYYSTQDTGAGDLTKRWKLFGFKDPCFSSSGYDTDCTTEISLSDLDNVTNIADVKDNPDDVVNGWYLNLDTAGTGFGAERVITDPLATTLGVVFYTTYKPYSEICAYGGKTVLWAVKYATGGAPFSMKGIALIQVSTGAIEQVDLSSALTEHGGRSSAEIEGVPPTAQGLSILIPPPPVKRTVHIKER